MKIRKVWLLQRAKAKTFNKNIMTGDYLSLDYMGASEFEWGAIPKFQRDTNARLPNMIIDSVTNCGKTLFFACEPDQVVDYKDELSNLLAGRRPLKESARIDSKWIDPNDLPDTWLDITNNCFISTKREVVENLFKTIPNSVRYMDEQKRKEA